jgi:hypothetical protein
MFVQILHAKCTDPDALDRQMDKWRSELMPNASGFLGSTSGITDDGELVVAARFSSEEEARANSDSAAQTEWWEETSRYLENVEFHDSTEVFEWGGGGSDDAGFVQVMEGKASQEARDRMQASMDDDQNDDMRPDVIGGYSAAYGDGEFTTVVYFTSEEEARKGEQDAQFQERQAEEMQGIEMHRFWDLRNPVFVTK